MRADDLVGAVSKAVDEMPSRFVLLDGLRGIAALSVMACHLSQHVGWPLFMHAWLAVDFFFLLSGFVLAGAYRAKLAAGPSFKRYMALRVRRLYPVLMIGLALAVAVNFIMGVSEDDLGLRVVLAVLTVPYIAGAGHIFALNPVQWTLMFEFIANAIHAAIPSIWRSWAPVALMLIGAGGLILAAWVEGSLIWGFTSGTLWVGLSRVLFSFFAGVLLSDLHADGRLSTLPSAPPIVLASILALVLIWPEFDGGAIRDLVTVAVIFPSLLALSVVAKGVGYGVFPIVAWGGWISYPLYAIHLPIRTLFDPYFSLGWWMPISYVVVVCLAASVLALVAEPTNRSPIALLRRPSST